MIPAGIKGWLATGLATLALASPFAYAEESAVTPTPGGAVRPAVKLTLAESSPVIGLTGETVLSIEVEDPPLSPMPVPRVLCSAGQIEDLGREGPAKFTARYILPTSRYPQPAILVAEFPDPHGPLRGLVTVRLRAAATPSFRTDPGAQVTLRVADRDYGPQMAAADGTVHVPVVVPPGVEFAVARSVNHGKSTEQMVDLHVPYAQRLLIAAPEVLRAGSFGEVAVYAVDPSGHPANAAELVLRAGNNRVQPLGSSLPGEARFLVATPTILKQKSMRIEAQLRGQSTTLTAARIALVPGAATGLFLEPEAPYFERKGPSSMRLFLGAEDAYGNPVDAGRAGVMVDGKPVPVKASADGTPMVMVEAPSDGHGPNGGEVLVEGVLDGAQSWKRIPIGVRAKPAPTGPRLVAYPRYTITPRLGVLTNFGPLAGATFFVDGFVYPSRYARGLGLGLGLGFMESWFDAQSTGGITRTDLSTIPLYFQIKQHVVRGRAFAALGVGAGFAFATARMRSYDASVFGHSFGAITEASVEAGYLLRKAHLVLALRYVGLYLSDLSSGEHLAGNAGGAMADVGYRRVW